MDNVEKQILIRKGHFKNEVCNKSGGEDSRQDLKLL